MSPGETRARPTGPVDLDTMLTGTQREIRDRLVERVVQAVKRVPTRRIQGGEVAYPPPGFKEPRVGNAFGLFGPRGAGKTTTLVTLLGALRRQLEGSATGRNWLVVDSPLDMSLTPPGTPLGFVVLHAVNEALCAAVSLRSRYATGELKDQFREVASTCFRGVAEGQRVLQNTAMSATAYAGASQAEAAARMKLPVSVARWLERATQAADVEGVVVAIDDLDLAAGDTAASLVWSLLDELHQPRLLILAAAEWGRLSDHLVRDPERNVDPEAARAVLYKVFRTANTEHLPPWTSSERRAFAPPEDGAASLGALLEQRCSADLAWIRPRLRDVLPGDPRGLENVYESVRSAATGPAWLRGVLRALVDASALGGADAVWASEGARTVAEQLTLSVDAAGELIGAFNGEAPLSPAWTRLVLDRAVKDGRQVDRSLRVCPAWRQRIEGAALGNRFSDRALGRLLSPANEHAAVELAWTRWRKLVNEQHVALASCGPWALMDAMAGRRDLVPEQELKHAGVSFADVAARAEAFDKGRTPMPFPRWTGAQQRLLDYLSRFPWDAAEDLIGLREPDLLVRLAASVTVTCWYLAAVGDDGAHEIEGALPYFVQLVDPHVSQRLLATLGIDVFTDHFKGWLASIRGMEEKLAAVARVDAAPAVPFAWDDGVQVDLASSLLELLKHRAWTSLLEWPVPPVEF